MTDLTTLTGRALDAEVARVVFGYEVVGLTTCVHVEGDWSIHPDSDPAGWSCYAENGPVYVDHCVCKRGPYIRKDDDPQFSEAVAQLNAESQANWEADHARFGHSRRCLGVVPCYSDDISNAWRVIEYWRARGEDFQLDSLGFRGEEWRCGFMEPSNGGMEIHWAEAPTAPLAISRAAVHAFTTTTAERGR